MAIPLLALGIPMVGLIVMRQGHLYPREAVRNLIILALLIFCAGAVFSPWYIETFRLASGAMWNPWGYSLQNIDQAFSYAFRDWSPVFSSAAVILPSGILISIYLILIKRPQPILGLISATFILSSLILFILTCEIRMLAVFQIGILAGAAVLLHDIYLKTQYIHRLHSMRFVIMSMVILIPLLIITCGNTRLTKDFAWYQVVDKPVMEALNYLKSQEDNGIVIEQGNAHGNLYLWWIEGYTAHPAFTASDPMWLNFKEEKEQKTVARQLLAGSAEDIDQLVSQYHVRYIFLDVGMAGDTSSLLNAGFAPVFSNERIAILRAGLLLNDPAPEWWPSDNRGLNRLRDVIPPRPAGMIGEKDADYYRVWYLEAKRKFIYILGSVESRDREIFVQNSPPDALWDDIEDLRSAEKAGVLGDPRYPGYHFGLWKAFGKPAEWPPTSLNRKACEITPPQPPPIVSTEAIKEWYKWNRSILATVYYGAEDSDPEIHASWVDEYDDLNLYTEIMAMRDAFNSGVVGSADEPFLTFREWNRAERD
jgi:hypothetical protein